MKAKFIKVVLIMGLFSLIFGGVGCTKTNGTKENEVKFSTFSQEERRHYINEFLNKEYGITCTISEVKQKQISAVENEEYYFATANTGEDIISVWISKSGEIIDTFYMLEMSDEFSKYFYEKVNSVVPGCKVKSFSEMRDMPTTKILHAENIDDYLRKEPVFTYIRVFVDADKDFTDNDVIKLQSAFDGYDAELYVYICDDYDIVDVNSYDLSSFDYSKTIEKGN